VAGREESRRRGLSPPLLQPLVWCVCLFFENILPNVSNGLRAHAILFSQCSAARAHELGILRALRVNVLRLHHNTERKQLISRIFVLFPYLNVFLHHASTRCV